MTDQQSYMAMDGGADIQVPYGFALNISSQDQVISRGVALNTYTELICVCITILEFGGRYWQIHMFCRAKIWVKPCQCLGKFEATNNIICMYHACFVTWRMWQVLPYCSHEHGWFIQVLSWFMFVSKSANLHLLQIQTNQQILCNMSSLAKKYWELD